jgi:hypothetical protein
MRSKPIVSLLGAAGLGGALLAGANAAAVPNPCTLVPSAAIASAFGGTAAPSGARSTRPDGKVSQTLCTFSKGDAKLQIMIAPHQVSGGSGGAPGMVVTHPSRLGSSGAFYYDTNPHFAFGNVSFTKAGLDVSVYDNGKLANAAMLALGRKVYAAIT